MRPIFVNVPNFMLATGTDDAIFNAVHHRTVIFTWTRFLIIVTPTHRKHNTIIWGNGCARNILPRGIGKPKKNQNIDTSFARP